MWCLCGADSPDREECHEEAETGAGCLTDRLVIASNHLVLSGAISGAAAVCLGAFGAHALADVLGPRQAEVWDTAVHYHLVHSLALLLCGSLTSAANTRALRIAGCCFGLGILLFSGSLYGLSLGGPRLLGPVTPLGGLLLITGWLALAVGAVRRPEHEPPRGS